MWRDKTEVELCDVFILVLDNEKVFLRVGRDNEADGTFGIYELQQKKLSYGVCIKIPYTPARHPKIVKTNNCMTKTTYWVHPVKLEENGEWMLPIEIDGWIHYATHVNKPYNCYWPYNMDCDDDIWDEKCETV